MTTILHRRKPFLLLDDTRYFDSWNGIRSDQPSTDFHDSARYSHLRIVSIYRRDTAAVLVTQIKAQKEAKMNEFFSWLTAASKALLPNSRSSSTSKDKIPTSEVEPVIFTSSSFNSLPRESFSTGDRGLVSWITLFSSPSTPTNSLIAGIATLPAKNGYLACHRHAQAEIYHIISGQGMLTVDGKEYLIQAGSVIFIPGNAEHGIQNTNKTEELRWLYCFAADRFQDIVYKF